MALAQEPDDLPHLMESAFQLTPGTKCRIYMQDAYINKLNFLLKICNKNISTF